MPAYLTIQQDNQSSHFNLDPERKTLIGRIAECTLQLNNSKVSSRHCRIETYGDYFFITDLNSTNGTYVNGSRIRSRKLYNGDIVQIGDVEVRFHWFDAEEDSDDDDNITEADYEEASDTITTPLSNHDTQEISQEFIGNYRILSKLGQGGIGEVYKAESISNPSLVVAIKVLIPKAMHSNTIVERFIREAQALKKFDHPRIIKVFELSKDQGRPFFSMEYIKGSPLHKFVGKNGAIAYRKALKIAGHIAHALDYTHKHNIIHRDLKPANVLIEDGTYHVKLIDLGLAKMWDESELTATGQVVGTPRYMAPEQMKSSREVDGRADIYSLGATLYHMLTGLPPYCEIVTSKRSELLRHIYHNPPTPIRDLVKIPDLVANIVEKAMEKDREKRFKTAGEMFKTLHKAVYKFSSKKKR